MRFCFCNQPVFGTDKITGIGYCKSHQYMRTDLDKRSITEKAMDKRKQESKFRSLPISNPSSSGYGMAADNKLVDNAAVRRLKTLTEFFSEVAVEIAKDPHCWNCGEKISPIDYRNSTAHILPKGIFRSVETHPLCYIVAGNRCGCHDDTHTMLKFSKMRVFPLAVQRFRQFENLITEKHKLLDEFLKYANLILL